jgi:quercetin dioxygenase-like cupin family protein
LEASQFDGPLGSQSQEETVPSIEEPLPGGVLVVQLDEERRLAHDSASLERSGRSARTLIKNGPLRITLVVLAPGGEIAEHTAPGPIAVQPLEGRLEFTVEGRIYDLTPGQILSAAGGVPHRVRSETGATFQLTRSVAGSAEP